MSERDFEVDGKKFKLNKLDPFKQLHIVRKMSPILGEILPIFQKLSKLNLDSMTEEQKLEAIFSAQGVTKVMQCIADLSDEDAERVVKSLCSAVEMQQDHGNWAKIVVGDTVAFQNLELPTLLQVSARSFMYNLSGFFRMAPQVSHGGA